MWITMPLRSTRSAEAASVAMDLTRQSGTIFYGDIIRLHCHLYEIARRISEIGTDSSFLFGDEGVHQSKENSDDMNMALAADRNWVIRENSSRMSHDVTFLRGIILFMITFFVASHFRIFKNGATKDE
jgi:hypothetical protein